MDRPLNSEEIKSSVKPRVEKNIQNLPPSHLIPEAQQSQIHNIVGRELILPTARRINETNNEPAMQRGMLNAIREATQKRDLAADEHERRIQELADFARSKGVSEDQIKSIITSDTPLKDVDVQKALDPAHQNTFDNFVKLTDAVLQGTSRPEALQSYVDHAKK